MATANSRSGVTIPAAYLEDLRSALVATVSSASDAVRTDHEDVLRGFGPEDRAAAVRCLREDMHVLDQLLDATSDTKLHGEPEVLSHALEETVRVLAVRLTEVSGYAPIPMGDVLEVSDRLRWAAAEAVRIYPELDHRLNSEAA
jgi:hypothetical protein